MFEEDDKKYKDFISSLKNFKHKIKPFIFSQNPDLDLVL